MTTRRRAVGSRRSLPRKSGTLRTCACLSTRSAGATAGLTRRLGFEFNGMALHEYYFGNLAADRALSPKSALADALATGWGDFRAWRGGFPKTPALGGCA